MHMLPICCVRHIDPDEHPLESPTENEFIDDFIKYYTIATHLVRLHFWVQYKQHSFFLSICTSTCQTVLNSTILNQHVMPQHLICPFCLFDFDAIIHLEDFEQDVPFILEKLGMKVQKFGMKQPCKVLFSSSLIPSYFSQVWIKGAEHKGQAIHDGWFYQCHQPGQAGQAGRDLQFGQGDVWIPVAFVSPMGSQSMCNVAGLGKQKK